MTTRPDLVILALFTLSPWSLAGETVQDIVAQQGGDPEKWQQTALAHGVEDPLRVPPGTPFNSVSPGNISPGKSIAWQKAGPDSVVDVA